ncbi:hypothetical protein HS088_TW04G00242 [Tripterygium wilfordii]|uniref:3'-5' exonuclease domain-containing protein n=1 Tax=Tripterygium wilfordii TaxID=458696 RepID=A0A7J7DPJ2_TRIWF|nr:piRNA biogenesis protein EXD1 isoform X2 [Tripterygium wilfordii]KAF5748290.1 hypothetical protein HS088_TW04G00242 [Tripterygium wilfordii]
MTSSPSQRTEIPLPSVPDGGPLDLEPSLSLVPVHVVTDASELPVEFLNPSPEKPLIIGFDCEGVDLCRYGTLCIMQLAFPDAIYLVDAIEGGEKLLKACKPALESTHITKVIHDCKRDSEALYFQFGIKLHNVVDTQIAYSLIEEQEGRNKLPDDNISFVGLLADLRYCGISYQEKEEVRILLRQDPKFWTYRPLSELMIRAAADDVRFLLYIYQKMMEKLNQRSLWYLALRGALYCRCFCINDIGYADWPSLPPVPDFEVAEGDPPEEEILSVLDVLPGKMGRIIGRRGSSILSIKESCNAEIIIGGAKGPPDKDLSTMFVAVVALLVMVLKRKHGFYHRISETGQKSRSHAKGENVGYVTRNLFLCSRDGIFAMTIMARFQIYSICCLRFSTLHR